MLLYLEEQVLLKDFFICHFFLPKVAFPTFSSCLSSTVPACYNKVKERLQYHINTNHCPCLCVSVCISECSHISWNSLRWHWNECLFVRTIELTLSVGKTTSEKDAAMYSPPFCLLSGRARDFPSFQKTWPSLIPNNLIYHRWTDLQIFFQPWILTGCIAFSK